MKRLLLIILGVLMAGAALCQINTNTRRINLYSPTTSTINNALTAPTHSYLYFGNGLSGGTRYFQADGSAADVGLSFIVKGSGTIALNAPVLVPPASITQDDALTRVLVQHGTTGQFYWRDEATLSGGLSSLNGLTGSTQTFDEGTSGTDFNISSSGSLHTFNIPDASITNRGLVTTGVQTFSGLKTFKYVFVDADDATTNSVLYPLSVRRTSTGTPATGIGTGINFYTETSAGNEEIGAAIDAVTSDVTAASEDFDLAFKTMTAGASPSTKLKLMSTGEIEFTEALVNDDTASQVLVRDVTDGTIKYRNATSFSGGGGTGATNIGVINSESKSSNGAVINVNDLVMQTADASFPGLVSTGTQTFAGAKTFNNQLSISASSGIYSNFDHSVSGAAYSSLRYNGTIYGYFGQASGLVSGGSDTDFAFRAQNNMVFSIADSRKMTINSSGNVGIGTASPNAPLQFASSVASRKVVLAETANNDHQFLGFGYNTGLLRYQIPATDWSHVFYAGTSSTTSDELMRITGTGRLGVGVASPTAKLHLPAGTATANTAPLKLTTGTALTTPEDGALEYHSSHLYFTAGSTRYQLDGLIGSTGSTDNAILRADGTGGLTAQGSSASINDTGDLTLGTSASGTSRSITAAGSGSDIALSYISKGTGSHVFRNVGNASSIVMYPDIEGDGSSSLIRSFGGNLVIETSTASEPIEINADNVKINQPALGNSALEIESGTNGVNTHIYQNTTATTSAAPETLMTIPTNSNFSYNVQAHIIAVQTGGTGGVVGNTSGYTLGATFKNVAGTLSRIGTVETIMEREDASSTTVSISASGTSITITVTGMPDCNYRWNCKAEMTYVEITPL